MFELNPQQFALKIKTQKTELRNVLNIQLPRMIGVEAVNHFSHNFQTESFDNNKWPEVKRRESWSREYKANIKHHPTRTRRKILTGDTGNLGRSIQKFIQGGKVTIFSDLVYAPVHNFGLKAGRSGFLMPRRQFIGRSEILNRKIKKQIEDKIHNTLK